MKTTKLILAGLAATAALLSTSLAQTAAVTDPVGYITIDIKAPGTLSFISPTLVNKVEFAGAVTSGAGNVLTVSGLTANAFNQTATPRFTHYVEVTNAGSTQGLWTNIVSNTATTITTQDTIPVTAQTTITVRKHTTVADFFGATNTAGLASGQEIGNADEVKVLNSETKAITSLFYYNDGQAAAWVDADFNEVADLPIEPQQGIYVQRKTGGAIQFTRVGHVKTGATMLTADPGINIVAVPNATGVSLAASNLANAGAQGGRVVSGQSIADADVIRVQQASGALKDVFYYDDGQSAAWVDADFNEVGTDILKEGTSYVLVRKPVGTLTWTAPAQVIQN